MASTAVVRESSKREVCVLGTPSSYVCHCLLYFIFRRVPAHERFRSLAEPSVSEKPAASSAVELPLPPSYQLLAEKFRCTDTVVNMLQKRKETCTFDKLKQAVQDMTRKEFKQRNLAQMKTVSPAAFVFRQEKCIPGNYDIKRYEQYQLTVECNTSGSEMRTSLGITDLIKRRKNFHQALSAILMRRHQAYLSSLTPPLEIPEHEIRRWHPDFRLDAVPDVAESELPQPPFQESYSSASDVLKAAAGKLSAKVELALSSVAAAAGSREGEGEGAAPVVTEERKLNPSLNGVSEALLKKVSTLHDCTCACMFHCTLRIYNSTYLYIWTKHTCIRVCTCNIGWQSPKLPPPPCVCVCV